ncbi:hypothetical protein [Candidatus Nucleicultrix amoebiphila]|jgi:hypothetical protein|uniref:hypothetical protein n=1 Tax=Candidatus Nucleicultrix amoebiphila TaxID=1509244 RepID=UPI0018DCBE13|nr:hypothetical protein [Candidatus Nucleicultrix amoebiphila]
MNEIIIKYDKYVRYGISFGSALAMVISYDKNHSVLWAILHGFFSWLYVLYYVLFQS